MATQLVSQEEYLPTEGAQILPADWAGIMSCIDNTVGWALNLLGINDGLPATSPVSCVAGSGLSVNLGGTNQFMVCQGWVLDVCALTNEILATANATNPRIDLIAVQATRVQGSQTVTRNVRPDSATSTRVTLSGTLVAGSATVTLPSGYTSPPQILGLTPYGITSSGVLRVVSVTDTAVVIDSTDSADTRSFTFDAVGAPTGSAGISTVINLYEKHPLWDIVTGTPAASPVAPATPAGYEAFATVLVPANATVPSTITILFPTIAAL